MRKRINLFSLLFLSTAILLTACGSIKNADKEEKVKTDVNLEAGGKLTDERDEKLFDGKTSKLKVVFPGGASSPASLDAVEEQMNEIISNYMDAEIDLEILEWGVFSDQQNLMLSSGEDVSLMFTFSSAVNYAASNKVLDITDLCNNYAKDALNNFSKYVEACKIGGKIYGLPTFHEYTKSAGLICRTDILNELNINPDSIKSWEDIEVVLAKVKEAHPDMNVLCPVEVGSGVLDYYNEGKFDTLVDGVGVRVNGDGAEILNIFDTSEFMELADLAYDWNRKGYFIADATTVTDTRQDLLSAGNTFGYIGQIHPGTATQELKNSGVEVTTIPVSDKALTTGNVNFAQYMIPTACSVPEKAVKLLDIMLTNKDMANLFMYGVEGSDYVIKDEVNNIVGYPEGINSSNVGWNNETWLAGNGTLAYVWESDQSDIWDQYLVFNDSATVSPLYGFTYDTQKVKTEITAITNVISKYKSVICAGYSEPKEAVSQMISELEASGINNILEDAKNQVEIWKRR